MKVDRIIKISEKFTIHVSYLHELFCIKTLDKIISISKDVKHPLYRFLINLSLTVLMGTVMTKTERHLGSFLAIRPTNFEL